MIILNNPQDSTAVPTDYVSVPTSDDEDDDDSHSSDIEESVDLSYSLKFMNPQKKSEYTIRKWRIKQKFTSVTQLESKLVENFDTLRPVDENGLSMGYIEPGHGYKGKQRWLCCDEDLREMYSIYSGKKEILMWCFLPGKQSKRSQSSDQRGGSSDKRSKVVESNSEVQDIVTKLQSKHGTTYSPEQYHAWAQLIQMGKQTSYDEPPQYTFFKVAPRSSSATIRSGVVSTMNSPGKRVHLRTELFTQLEKLEGLFKQGSLTKEQCDELKKSIMGDIKKL